MRLTLYLIFLFYSFTLFSQSITIISPTEGYEFDPFRNTAEVLIDVQNFVIADENGDGHIHWTIQESTGAPIIQPMKYNTNPETIDVVDGKSYIVYMELVDNNHAPINPPINATLNFSIASFTEINGDLTEIRSDVANNGAGGYYRLLNTITCRVTYLDVSTNRIWLQDADNSGDGEISGIVIYDPLGAIQNTYTVNDVLLLDVLDVQSEVVNGVTRLIPYFEQSFSPINEPVPTQIITIPDFNANYENYESELIELENVTFDDGNGVTTFSVDTNYNLTDVSINSIIKRTEFASANYIGEIIPSVELSTLLALGGESNGIPEIYVRDLSDMTLGNNDFMLINDLLVYPNPTNSDFKIKSNYNSIKSISITNMMGEIVFNKLIQNDYPIDISFLSSGFYILRISDDGIMTTRKLMKK